MKFRILSLLIAFAPACGELPDPEPADSGVKRGDALGGDSDYVPPEDNDPPPEAPQLETAPPQYGYETLPVRGTAAPYLTIFVEGGRSPVATDVTTDGRFCVDVPLRQNASQTLRVFAQDERGVTSDPSELTVTQDPSLEETFVPEQPLVDLAGGRPVYSDVTPKEGTFDAVSDDNPTTDVLMSKGRLWIDLGDWYDIEKLSIVFTDSPGDGDDTFATEYEVLASDYGSPTMPPDAGNPGWDLLYDVAPDTYDPGGDGGIDTFELPVVMNARYVAFYLKENNKTDWFSSENIRVADVYVFGRSTEDLPAQSASPSCSVE